MANLTITNNDVSNVIHSEIEQADGLLVFGSAGTVISGTILARDSVSLKYVIFVKGGATNENGIPKAVVSYDITATGAGDVSIRAIVKGNVKLEKLVIDADGDATNIDAAVTDELRDYAIVALSVKELNITDNQ